MEQRLADRVLVLLLSLAIAAGALPSSAWAAAPAFFDVPYSHWAYDDIQACAGKGIVDGVGGGMFEPDAPVTNAAMVKMLCTAFFGDEYKQYVSENREQLERLVVYDASVQPLPETPWYSFVSCFFQWKGLLRGVDFEISRDDQANKNMDRRNMAQIVFNVLEQKGARASERQKLTAMSGLSDYGAMDAAEKESVGTCYALGIINGKEDGAFDGGSSMTRAEACAVITRLFGVFDGTLRLAVPDLPVELIRQDPELPNGCEVTSMAMALGAAGCPVDKLTLYNCLPREPITTSGGRRYGPDPEKAYAGDAAKKPGGWYCFEGPAMEAADRWLDSQGAGLRAVSVTGLGREELEVYAQAGTPVVCWVTVSYAQPKRSDYAWRLADGTVYHPYSNLHCVVLAGMEGDTYRVADPVSGMRRVNADLFWSSFSAMGRRAVVVGRA